MDKLSYFAGVVDGEGSITLYLRSSKSLRLRIQVANTSTVLMDWLKINYGGTVSPVKRNRANHKLGYMWFTDGEKAYDLIKLLEPYLLIKQPQARVSMEAWETRASTPLIDRRKPIPLEIIERRKQYVDEMHVLNKKGV